MSSTRRPKRSPTSRSSKGSPPMGSQCMPGRALPSRTLQRHSRCRWAGRRSLGGDVEDRAPVDFMTEEGLSGDDGERHRHRHEAFARTRAAERSCERVPDEDSAISI